jgi:hypothetical protein
MDDGLNENNIRDDVAGTLAYMGYREVRFRDGEWAPLSAVNGELGTTAETEIHDRKGAPTCRLVDGETGERIGTARLSCPVDRT